MIYNYRIVLCYQIRDLARISSWAKKWKVTFNPNKSKDMIFTKKKCLYNSPPLILNNAIIEKVDTHKHLGVFLKSNLEWTKQINEACLRANRKLSWGSFSNQI